MNTKLGVVGVMLAGVLAGCAPGARYSLDLSAPTAMSLTAASGASAIAGDVMRGDVPLELFYVASTAGDDNEVSPAPVRLSLLTPMVDSEIVAGAAALMFRAPGVTCPDLAASWSGSVSWVKPMPDYELVIDAHCTTGTDHVTGVLSGNL